MILLVLVVCRWSLAGRCLGGGGSMAFVSYHNMGPYFNGVLHLCAHSRTHQYTISDLHTCGHWHLQRFSCPDRRSLNKEKAACVAY